MKKFLSVILSVVIIVSALPMVVSASEQDTVILYTNDVHCAIDDYAALAAYRAELIAKGNTVITVDAGDAIQGEIIGSMTEGEAVVDIMNAVGYDYAVPGNHEFDYGMEVFLNLAQNKAEYDYISSNFHYLPRVKPVFSPYAIEDFGDYQVAFIGISTPETITKSTPDFFKDENGNYVYGFPKYPGGMTNEALYENIQESVDNAVSDGADIVVAVGHTGIMETTDGWKSTDIIANTDGIDYFIDAHSHQTIVEETYKNQNNEDVIITSTGTKFANFGVMTISSNGNVDFKLVNPDTVNIDTLSGEAKTAYNDVKSIIDDYNEDIAYLFDEIGTSEVHLVAYDDDNSWAVRKRETNAGDFVADAYRTVTGADVAIANGGGIRAEIEVGGVTRKNLMDINAFNNEMCVLEVTGQQLVDVLEHGARECPESLGGFLQVSGVSFEIHNYIESPVVSDMLGNFIYIDTTMERRVQNVVVNDEPVDLGKTYTLAGSQYVLTQGGDGLTMLEGSKVVQKEGLPCDSEMLIKYFTEVLNGEITADKYGNPDGDGRITIVDESFDAPDYDYEISCGETITVEVGPDKAAIVKFVPEFDSKYVLSASSDELDTYCSLYEGKLDEQLTGADDENGYDFVLKYEFESGKHYYFEVNTYSGDANSFEISLECGHNFEGDTCIVCGKTCDHNEPDFLGFCHCGAFYVGTDIVDGDEYELENKAYNEIFWFRFTPEISGLYSLKSISEIADPDCFLYSADGEYLASSYDVNNMDFDLIHYLEAGETYYFDVHNCYDEGNFRIALNRVTHTADDGSEHTNIDFVEGTYSNCTEHGFTDGLYCNECEEFISGHEERPLDEEAHVDDDYDDVCDLCGEENLWNEDDFECEHLCHSDNWFMKIIWTIANFFNRLLKLSPECECGVAHY